jgi:hypothetical protein
MKDLVTGLAWEVFKVSVPADKGQLLEQAGYAYGFDRMIYFNRQDRKAFSLEFVEDHTESEIQRLISEATGGAEWRFYFNSPPSDSVKRELERVLS